MRMSPVLLLLLASGTPLLAGGQAAGKGTQKPAAAAQQAGAPPQVSVAGVRVVGPGLGANATELRPFNESPGTTLALAIQAPKGTGIVDIDSRGSRLEGFADDKGQSLLEEGRLGPFPKVAEDGSVALVEVEVRGRPSTGATAVTAQGIVALTLAGGSKPTRAANVKLVEGQPLKIGATTMTLGEVKTEEESTAITINLPRSVLTTIREARFFDAKNEPLESNRTSSGYFNEKAQLEYRVKTKDKAVTIEFELWQNLRVVKAAFNVQAGLGVAAGAAASTTGAAQKPDAPAKVEKPAGPPPAIGPNDGAESIEAVVKQLQTSAIAGKGAQMLAVIYPTERGAFGQIVAMALAFLPMASMDNEKATAQMQKDLDAFFAKHKLTPPFAREPEELFKGVDLAAFVSDAMAFMKARTPKGDKPGDNLPVPPGRPENVTITGDTAVATLGGKEVKFKKIGSRWFISLE